MPVSWWLRLGPTDPVPEVLRDLCDRGYASLVVVPGPTRIVGVYVHNDLDILSVDDSSLRDHNSRPRYVIGPRTLPEFTSRVTRLMNGSWLPHFPQDDLQPTPLEVSIPATELNRAAVQGLHAGVSMGTRVEASVVIPENLSQLDMSTSSRVHQSTHDTFRQEYLGSWLAPPRERVMATVSLDLQYVHTLSDLANVFYASERDLVQKLSEEGASPVELFCRESVHSPYHAELQLTGGFQQSLGVTFFRSLDLVHQHLELVWEGIHRHDAPVSVGSRSHIVTRWDVVLQDDFLT